MGKHKKVPVLPTFDPLSVQKEDEEEFLISEQHLPSKPYYVYLQFGEYVTEDIQLKEFDTQEELDAYQNGVSDALGFADIRYFTASVSIDGDMIRLLPEG